MSPAIKQVQLLYEKRKKKLKVHLFFLVCGILIGGWSSMWMTAILIPGAKSFILIGTS